MADYRRQGRVLTAALVGMVLAAAAVSLAVQAEVWAEVASVKVVGSSTIQRSSK